METKKLTKENAVYIQNTSQIEEMSQKNNFDRESLVKFFSNATKLYSFKSDILSGNIKQCHSKAAIYNPCCKYSGKFSLMKLFGCSTQQKILMIEKNNGNCEYVSKSCAKEILGHCVKWTQTYNCFQNVLAKIIHYGIKEQLNKEPHNMEYSKCDNFGFDKIDKIDFSLINFDEFSNYGNVSAQQDMLMSMFGVTENYNDISG
jgi:hypothetical protein